MAFLEMIFNCGKDERCLSFATVAQGCMVQPIEVEMLVMKAMSLDLVRGSIDEVAKLARALDRMRESVKIASELID